MIAPRQAERYTTLTGTVWLPVIGSAALALVVSPLLAGWTAALAEGQVAGWWRPRRVTRRRRLVVAGAVVAVGVLAGVATPWAAWWLFALGGCVLAVVDAERHVLPSRLLYPLAGVEFAVLGVTALVRHEPDHLERAVFAAVMLGLCWFTLAFVAGGGIGLGDVRLAAMTGGLLGWLGWTDVLHGQLVAVVLSGVTGCVVALLNPSSRSRAMRVPLGPALVLSTVLVSWA
ncbi:prepilin peptidase [Jatrophihabitans sp. YIM 134969]